MLAGKEVTRYYDDSNLKPFTGKIKVGKNGEVPVTIQPNGGLILTDF
jgi:hypothetical protein